jgi:hypothetical protein
MINQTWYRYPCDGAIVADEPTAQVLRRDGVDHDRIHTLGFPVGLEFDEFLPAPPPGDGRWRVIFFPGGPNERAIHTLQMLGDIENLHTTVVTAPPFPKPVSHAGANSSVGPIKCLPSWAPTTFSSAKPAAPPSRKPSPPKFPLS